MYEVIYTDDAKALSANARNKVLANFNNEKVAQQYIQLYQSVL